MRKEQQDAAAIAEWERLNGTKRDKYSDMRVDREVLVRLDKELEKQQLEVRSLHYCCTQYKPLDVIKVTNSFFF